MKIRNSRTRSELFASSLGCFVVIVILITGCHRRDEVRNDVSESASQHATAPSGTPRPSKKDGETAPDPGRALRVADETVERARIMSLPLEPLSSRVIQGMALPLYAELPDLDYEKMLKNVASLGATHVSIVVSWHQRTIFANELAPSPDETPRDARVLQVIDAAHSAGLKVLFFPIIHVDLRNEGEWRGRLAPGSPKRWKTEYRKFILHYAKLAEKGGVEVFSVGSELSSMEKEEAFWRSVIDEIRGVYDGKLLYSANWDHYQKPKFWDALDYIGVSSYFEIARRNDEPIFTMTDRWKKYRDEMLEFSKTKERPLILTEVGYPTIDSSAVKPWDYTARTAPNQNAQLAAFRSLADTWTLSEPTETGGFSGLFIWHAWGPGGADDVSYAIWNKSTQEFVRRWFRH